MISSKSSKQHGDVLISGILTNNQNDEKKIRQIILMSFFMCLLNIECEHRRFMIWIIK